MEHIHLGKDLLDVKNQSSVNCLFFLESQELLLDIYERLDDLGADKVNI